MLDVWVVDPRDARIAELEALLVERDARIADLEARLEVLSALVDQVRREGKRQAAPFRKEAPKADPKRPGRKKGGGDGPHSFRQPPGREPDRVVPVELPPSCPDCGCGELDVERIVSQLVEDLPANAVTLTRFDVQLGRCHGCGVRVQPRHADQASDAFGAAGSQLGPRAVAFAAYLHKVGGLSLGKTVAVLAALGLTVTTGGLAQAFARLAGKGELTYQALIEQIRTEPAVTADETGWRVDATSAWLWAFVASRLTVYMITAGRGFEDACQVLGRDYAGVLIRDGWAPYRRFGRAAHQSCAAHLLRRSHELCEKLPAAHRDIPQRLQVLLQDALTVRTARDAGGFADNEDYAAQVTGLEVRLNELVGRSSPEPDVARLLKHLHREQHAVLTFLYRPDIDATNWKAETGIRPAVVNRKSWGGNRTNNGADTQQILMTIFRTAAQQGHDIINTFARLLTNRTPTVIPFTGLAPPPPG